MDVGLLYMGIVCVGVVYVGAVYLISSDVSVIILIMVGMAWFST